MQRRSLGLWQNLRWKLAGKQLVGTDKYGNKYFLRHAGYGEDGPLYRRAVEYADTSNNPHSIPTLWSQWLIGNRKEAPSDADIDGFEKTQNSFLKRVKEVEAKENKLIRQERVQQRLNAGISGGVDMSVDGYLRQLEETEK